MEAALAAEAALEAEADLAAEAALEAALEAAAEADLAWAAAAAAPREENDGNDEPFYIITLEKK
jgi:hypothetical protein